MKVKDSMRIEEIDTMMRRVQQKFQHATNGKVILATVGIYAQNQGGKTAAHAHGIAMHIATEESHVLQAHGFYIDEEWQSMNLHIVVNFETPNREAVHQKVLTNREKRFPAY